ncbi:hypothetical protein KC19_VG338300 [Ceratodon purpureus]|uniref:Uncharacterized protein n=1 Tax=Ceratodon purpureus TaxID=3225 RepID=A0A8T0HWV0_CERPU|nr:hypothetical protein KC19_VG338300 [Ceratodon purpureus]
MKDLRDASMKFCMKKLSPWTEEDGETMKLADLEGLDLHDFGASQVLCTMEALGRVGDLGNLTHAEPQDGVGDEEDQHTGDKTAEDETEEKKDLDQDGRDDGVNDGNGAVILAHEALS